MNETMNSLEPISHPEEKVPLYQPAGFWERVGATLLDNFILAVVQLVAGFGLGLFIKGESPKTNPQDAEAVKKMLENLTLNDLLPLIITVGVGFIITFFYYGIFYKWKGATPGKLAMGLRVQHCSTKEFIGFGRMFVREFLGKTISLIIFCLGYLFPLFNKKKRALHDYMAGTQVISIDDEIDDDDTK